MQKYADLNRHTHFAKTGGKLVISNKKRKSRKKRNYQFKLWLVTISLFFVCFLYIRYQALYVEKSVFRDLYRLIYQHFLAKEILPPIASEAKVIEAKVSETKKKSISSSAFSKKKIILQPNNLGGSKKSSISSVKISREQTAQSSAMLVEKDPTQVEPSISVGLYHPYLDLKKNVINFLVVSKKLNRSFGTRERSLGNKKFYQYVIANLVRYQSKSKNIKNVFHPQTQLINAWVENETLILDFNRYFERSKFGYKGIEIRIQQILWTFLKLRTYLKIDPIYYISILIDGERKDRIGGDGFTLKPFYSRKDLKAKIYYP